jgi:magnesium transporter
VHLPAIGGDGRWVRHGLLARPEDSAGQLRLRLQQQRTPPWDLVCVTDGERRLLGTLTPADLLALPDAQLLGTVANPACPRATVGTTDEQMASIALHHGVSALPVVSADGALRRVAGTRDLMNVLRREHVQDLHRLAGIARESMQAPQALHAAPLRRLRHRLPWLLAGLVGTAAATLVVARFEHAMNALPAVAFFMPGLVYLADAIGTQSETIAVRGLSLSHMNLRQLFAAELRTGLLLGLVLSSLAFPLVLAVLGNLRLAAAVALALAIASTLAATLGLAMPALLQRMGVDPAYGSGPIATIVQDVLTLAVYFGCVSLIVL